MSPSPKIQATGVAALKELLLDDVVAASEAMLGWDIVTPDARVRIVETEAYRTPDDPACHAHLGRTKRNEVLFGPPGFAYVYFTYGNHWMLNASAHPDGIAAAVLIRAARPIEGLDVIRSRRPKAKRDQDLLSGPGKLCQALAITGQHNAFDLFAAGSYVRLEPGCPPEDVGIDTRIGLAPGKGTEWPWRFLSLDDEEWVSRRMPRPKPIK